MAQRGTGYAKRSGATEAIVADAVMRSMEDDDAAPRPVVLDLGPLIAPYRKHGRLSLRVERLPPRGRLTRGHNNGDRSWSLMSDELDGLAYLPPKGAAEICTLGIRIVSLDGGDGGTLALIDYPLSSAGSAPPPVMAERPAASRRIVAEDDGELARLRGALADAKAALAESEAEMVAARERFERELQDQLSASSKLAAEMLERERAQTRIDDAARSEATKDAAKEDVAKADARTVKLLAEAEGRAAKRLAEAEARAAKELAEMQAQLDRARSRGAAETARERSDEAERKRLRDEVQRLKKSLAGREEELAQSQAAWQRENATTLARAEGAWRDRESRELADARHQWQERSERALTEAKAQFERAQNRADSEASRRIRDLEAEVERLHDDLASANGAIADRESDIADVQARLDAQTARADALGAHEDEIRRLQDEIGRLKGGIAERERTIAKTRAEMEQAGVDAHARLAQTRLEAQTVLDRAKADWRAQSEATLAAKLAETKRQETARLQTLEAEVQNQTQVQLARNARRIKELEAERDQFRAHADALLKRGDSDDIKQLRRDFGHLQALLATREQEIAQLTLDSEHARERWTAEARLTMQKAEHEWKAEAEAAEREERKALSTRRTVRDVALVGAFSALAVMFYLYGSPMDWIAPTAPPAAVAATTPAPAAAAAPAHMVTILKSANVRSGPSKTADIVATLPKAAALASLERHGNWVRVKLRGAKASDGWVYASYLADAPPAHP